jgi:hypothetical protein
MRKNFFGQYAVGGGEGFGLFLIQIYKKCNEGGGGGSKTSLTSKNQPSSNRPFQCAICDNIFCSYFMENHYAQSHVGVDCPNNLIIKEDEKKAVLLTRK